MFVLLALGNQKAGSLPKIGHFFRISFTNTTDKFKKKNLYLKGTIGNKKKVWKNGCPKDCNPLKTCLVKKFNKMSFFVKLMKQSKGYSFCFFCLRKTIIVCI